MWFSGKKWERLVDALERQVRDLQEALVVEREFHLKERTTLIDRVMALSNPATLREVRRDRRELAEPAVGVPLPSRPVRSNPGYFVDMRPPHRPPWADGGKEVSQVDLHKATREIAEAMAVAGAEATKK